MSLLTDNPVPPRSVGLEGDEAFGRRALVALETPVQWMRDCKECGCAQIFVAGWSCADGLVGYCSGCSGEAIAPFTRTNSEVA